MNATNDTQKQGWAPRRREPPPPPPPSVLRIVVPTRAADRGAVAFNRRHRLLAILDLFPYFLGRLDNIARDYECRVLVLEADQEAQFRKLYIQEFGIDAAAGLDSFEQRRIYRRTGDPLSLSALGSEMCGVLAEEVYARDPTEERLVHCPLCRKLIPVQCRRVAECRDCRAWWPVGCGYLEGGAA